MAYSVVSGTSSATSAGDGGQGYDLAAMQGFEERLDATLDEAPEAVVVDLHLADPGRQCHLPRWRGAYERNFEAADRFLLSHTG